MDQTRRDFTYITKVMGSLTMKRQEALLSITESYDGEWKKPYQSELSFLTLCRQGVLGLSLVLGIASSKWVLRQEGCSQLAKPWKAYVYVGLVGAYDAVLGWVLLGHHSQVINLMCDDYILEAKAREQS